MGNKQNKNNSVDFLPKKLNTEGLKLIYRKYNNDNLEESLHKKTTIRLIVYLFDAYNISRFVGKRNIPLELADALFEDKLEISYPELEKEFLTIVKKEEKVKVKLSNSMIVKMNDVEVEEIDINFIIKQFFDCKDEIDDERLHTLFEKLGEGKKTISQTRLTKILTSVFEILNIRNTRKTVNLKVKQRPMHPTYKNSSVIEKDVVKNLKRDINGNYSFFFFKISILTCLAQMRMNKLPPIRNLLKFSVLTLKRCPWRKKTDVLQLNGNLDKLKKKVSQNNEEKKEVVENQFQLPAIKGLRFIILSEVMKRFEMFYLLRCGLVSKEWLAISRCDLIWRKKLDDLIRSETEKREERRMNRFNEGTEDKDQDDEPLVQDKEEYPFLQYWMIIYNKKKKDYLKKKQRPLSKNNPQDSDSEYF